MSMQLLWFNAFNQDNLPFSIILFFCFIHFTDNKLNNNERKTNVGNIKGFLQDLAMNYTFNYVLVIIKLKKNV